MFAFVFAQSAVGTRKDGRMEGKGRGGGKGQRILVRGVFLCEQIHASRMTGGGRRGVSSAGLFDFLFVRLNAER